ncbi:MAG: GvpL/GvpF family gas vesicle protein [Dehalococcoidales bacterium]|nr:GvpL/GvpF family gas vesicle protein [Dehalococcoidales bacterium]
MSLERKYIYGIIEEADPKGFNFSGVGEVEVYTINYRRLAAVVSDTGFKEIDPTRKNVRAHTLVQEELLKTYNLLPMGFGMIANSKNAVLKLLEKNYQGLTDELMRLAGKVQVELKVFWDQEAMIKELQSGSEELTRLKTKIKNAWSAVETQRLLIEAGQLVERVVVDWKSKYADRLYTTLKTSSIDARQNNPLGVKNILNASFLIEKTEESDFQKQVYKLDSQYQDKVNFKYVGPLPPYSFVTLKLEPVS